MPAAAVEGAGTVVVAAVGVVDQGDSSMVEQLPVVEPQLLEGQLAEQLLLHLHRAS